MMKHVVMLAALAALTALAAAPAPAQDTPARSGEATSAELLAAGRAQLAAHHLDSAAALVRRVAEGPARSVTDRVQALILLGVVDFYRTGDSAAAGAFRRALALDPGFEVSTLDQFEPAIARLLVAQRSAVLPRADPVPQVHDCVRRCPEGVRPPHFIFFPQIEFADASVRGRTSRMRSFLTFQALIAADGIIEPESVLMLGGTARGTEAELRRGLAQARFAPGRADGVPVRTRVTLRFDFEAEGTTWIKYTYRVVAR